MRRVEEESREKSSGGEWSKIVVEERGRGECWRREEEESE